jgi:hypothetical protein
MKRLAVACVVLAALACGSCKKSTPEATTPSEAKPQPRKALRDVLLGTWAVRDIGKGRREFTATYTADGVTETRAADGRSEKEQYRVLDDRTIEYAGPPAVKGTVAIVSDNELKIEFPDGVVIQLTRQK